MPEQDVLAPTIFGAVARRKFVTAVVVIGCAAIGFAYSFTRTPVATASASIVVAAPTSTNGSTDPNFIADQVAIIELPSTADAAAAILKRQDSASTLSGKDVLKAQTVLNGANSNLITVEFSDRDPQLAEAGANSVITAYTDLLASTAAANLQQQVSRLSSEIDSLYTSLVHAGGPTTVNGAAINASRAGLIATRSQLIATGGNSPSVTNKSLATLPEASRSLGAAEGLALGALAGLVIAVALAYVVAQTRRKFTDRFQPESLLQRPLLSDVPDFALEGLQSDVPATDAPESSAAEAFRFVSAALDNDERSDGPLVVAVTGASSLDGKTSTAANLAVTFARRGLRTVAVDADLEGQGLGFLLLGDDRHATGLAEILAKRTSLESVLRPTTTGVDPQLLSVVPAGLLHGPQVNDMVSVARVSDVLEALAGHADVIVIDVPSPLQVAYSSSILKAVGRCTVIVPHGTNPRKLGDLTQRLAALGIDPTGYVYTKAPLRKELGMLSQYVTDRRRMPFMPGAKEPVKPRSRAVDDAVDPVPAPEPVSRPTDLPPVKAHQIDEPSRWASVDLRPTLPSAAQVDGDEHVADEQHEGHVAEEQQAEGRPAVEEHVAEGHVAEEQPADEQREGHVAEEQQADERPAEVDTHVGEARSHDDIAVDGHPEADNEWLTAKR